MRHFTTAIGFSVCLCLAPFSNLAAQETPDADSTTRDVPTSTDRFITVSKGITTGIDISEKDAELELAIAGGAVIDEPKADGTIRQNAIGWKLGVEVPVGGKSDVLDNATLDMLEGGLTFNAGLTWTHTGSALKEVDEAVFKPHRKRAIEACIAQQSASKCAIFQRPNFQSSALIEEFLPDLYKQLLPSALLPNRESFWVFGLKGSLGVQNFDYTTQGAFIDMDETHESYSIAASFAYFPDNRVSSWSLEAEYGDAYEAADETIVCRTVVTDPAEDCKKAAPLAPTSEESLVVRAEYRNSTLFSFGANDKHRIGYAVTGSVDTLSGDIGLEVPIFLGLGGDSPFLPGVKIGYAKDTDKPNDMDESLSIAVFLKTSFGFGS